MTVFFLFVFGFYFILLLLMLYGWEKAMGKTIPVAPLHSKQTLTVIIPFRNEENNLVQIIEDLSHQKPEVRNFEVLFIDDHSTDRSTAIVNEAIRRFSQFKLMSLPKGIEGKKQAIALGVEKSMGDIVVTSDADCHLHQGWLTSINSFFHSDQVMMVFGGVKIKENSSFFSKLQALEFASLIGSGAAMANLGIPTMCNGANLAFRKSAFYKVGGYDGNFSVASGDDEFLMRKIHKEFPGSIYFLNQPESVVSTNPQQSLGEFLHQRLRWAGKWRYNDSLSAKLLAVFILFFQFSFAALLIFLLAGMFNAKAALFLMGGKLVLEFIFVSKVCAFLTVRWRSFAFLLLQFSYPFYVVFIGIASNFVSPLWKERKI